MKTENVEQKVAARLAGEYFCEYCGITMSEAIERHGVDLGFDGMLNLITSYPDTVKPSLPMYVNKDTESACCWECRDKCDWYTRLVKSAGYSFRINYTSGYYIMENNGQ